MTNYPNGIASFGFPVIGSGPYMTVGKAFFVHSDTGIDARGRGLSPETPFASIAYAITHTRASKGDCIFVMPGHTERVSGANAWPNTGKHGISIIGLGNPGIRPVITFDTATTAQIIVAASGVTFENLLFDLTGIDAVAAAFLVTGGEFCMSNCRVAFAGTSAQATKVFLLSGHRPRFLNCDFYSTGAAGPASAIESAGAVDGLEVIHCRFRGNFSVAAIVAAGTNHLTDMLVEFCDILQTNGTAKNVISVTNSSTGSIRYNTYRGTSWGSAADAINGTNAALKHFQNFGIDDTAAEDSGILVPAAGTVS
jgi:hypothetical protein